MGSTIGAAREAYAAAAASSSSSYYVQQADAPWGLARLSHRDNGSQTYLYDASAGQGTCAYILDTGIYVEHDVRVFLPLLPSPLLFFPPMARHVFLISASLFCAGFRGPCRSRGQLCPGRRRRRPGRARDPLHRDK